MVEIVCDLLYIPPWKLVHHKLHLRWVLTNQSCCSLSRNWSHKVGALWYLLIDKVVCQSLTPHKTYFDIFIDSLKIMQFKVCTTFLKAAKHPFSLIIFYDNCIASTHSTFLCIHMTTHINAHHYPRILSRAKKSHYCRTQNTHTVILSLHLSHIPSHICWF